MGWEILYVVGNERFSSVRKWLDSLTKDALKAVAKELELLRLSGNQLRLPHSRSLEGGLFELRERDYGFRMYYAFQAQKIIILLAAGNKDSQEKDIKIARKKLANLMTKGGVHEIKKL